MHDARDAEDRRLLESAEHKLLLAGYFTPVRDRCFFRLGTLYEERFAREPFVDVMPPGSHPDTRSVRAANTCRIALHRPPQSMGRGDMLVVLSVIDNLVKGAAGQAVQNMNLMFGIGETIGLQQPAVVP